MLARKIIACLLAAASPGPAWSQSESGNQRAQLGIFSGALRVGQTADATAGNIRWTGTDFEGYTGSVWASFTSGGTGWTDGGALVRQTTVGDQLGIGTSNPEAVSGAATLFANVDPKVEFLTGTDSGTYQEFLGIRHAVSDGTAVLRRLGLLFKQEFESDTGNWKGAAMIMDSQEANAANPRLHLVTDNYERLTVSHAGSVGVSFTAPDDLFQVLDTTFTVSATSGVHVGGQPGSSGLTAGDHGDMSLYGPGTNGAGAAVYWGDNYAGLPVNLAIGEKDGLDTNVLEFHGKDGFVYTVGTDPTWDGATPDITVTNAGRVGIGNTNPTHRMHVAETGAESLLSLHRQDAGTAGVTRDAGSIEYRGTDNLGATTAVGLIRGVHLDPGAGVDRSAMTFYTRSLAAYTEKMRINHDGRVGVGSTLPGSQLTVNGDAQLLAMSAPTNAPGRLYFDSSNNVLRISTATTGQWFVVGPKVWYKTSSSGNGSTPLTACASGYHVCRVSEITEDRSWRKFGDTTPYDGGIMWVDSRHEGGTKHCSNFTSTSGSAFSTVAKAIDLTGSSEAGILVIDPEDSSGDCSDSVPTMCCSNP